jgi:hypothetical protein
VEPIFFNRQSATAAQVTMDIKILRGCAFLFSLQQGVLHCYPIFTNISLAFNTLQAA